jgi:serine/threonine protein kinase
VRFPCSLEAFSTDCVNFLSKALRLDPYARATVDELLAHPWVANLDKEAPPLFSLDTPERSGAGTPGTVVEEDVARDTSSASAWSTNPSAFDGAFGAASSSAAHPPMGSGSSTPWGFCPITPASPDGFCPIRETPDMNRSANVSRASVPEGDDNDDDEKEEVGSPRRLEEGKTKVLAEQDDDASSQGTSTFPDEMEHPLFPRACEGFSPLGRVRSDGQCQDISFCRQRTHHARNSSKRESFKSTPGLSRASSLPSFFDVSDSPPLLADQRRALERAEREQTSPILPPQVE